MIVRYYVRSAFPGFGPCLSGLDDEVQKKIVWILDLTLSFFFIVQTMDPTSKNPHYTLEMLPQCIIHL